MKYTILINQQAIVSAGLHLLTDLTDWAILDYIQSWSFTGSGSKKGNKVWINYAHLIEQMPLLGITSKGGISKRLAKLRDIGLILTEKDELDQRIYVEMTSMYHNVVTFQPQFEKQELREVNTSVIAKKPPGCSQETSVDETTHSYNHQIQLSVIQPSEIQPPPLAESARVIFEHWKKTFNHDKSKLDAKRLAIIIAALKLYSQDDLITAINGCSKTPHNMGKNDRNEIYDGIHIIFGGADQIDRFIRNASGPVKRPIPTYIPPELRGRNSNFIEGSVANDPRRLFELS